MSAERYRLVKQLFHDALDRPRGERDAFLRDACGDDEELRREVVEMLAVEDSSPDFLESTTLGEGLAASSPLPEQLGPFRVLRLLGEGGMGAVYEAEQDRPRRRVALKVLHTGLGTPQMLRRFELEGEVLGRLEHPGIARVYEVGSSDTGRGLQPWFAMELVDGEPLTDYCTRRDLRIDDRIQLVAEVCDAVHHAHQRGVVHRDIKPANVLVDREGRPKVLDFGIARATSDELQRATLRTDPGMIVGTLQYMSPEQATADPDALDVRADVYSLGVILYELVAGRPPLELGRVPMHEALRQVMEDEPPPLRTTAARRVPVDVSVITHKALEKDKDRRYASAAELAADLRRYLRREPITAQPPSGWYRLRRFAARNRALVGGVAATFVALLAGLTLALWQRNEARTALARAEGINEFLLSDLLAAPSPERLGHDARVVDVLAPAMRSAERTFADQPGVAAEILDAVGGSYRALGLAAEAEHATRRALELLGETSRDRLALRARGHLVEILADLDRADDAVAMGESLVEETTATLGAEDPDTLAIRATLATVRFSAGQPERSVEELRAVAEAQARVLGEDDARTLATRSTLAVDLAAIGGISEGRELLAETLERQDRVLGPEHPTTLNTRNNLAWILTLGSAWKEAEAIYEELLPLLESVYGADHPYTALARIDMAQCPIHLDRLSDAEVLVHAACDALERRVGPEHTWTLDAHLILAEVYFRKGEHAAAIAEANRVVEVRRAAGGPPDGNLGHALAKLGRCYQEAGDQQAAAATFREAAQVYREAFHEPTDYLAQMLYNLGVATQDAGDPQAAIAPFEEALSIDVDLWGPDHRHVISDRYNLARTLLEAGRPADAVTQMQAVLASAKARGFEAERTMSYRTVLGLALVESGDTEAGERRLLEAVTAFREAGRDDDDDARLARQCLVRLYERQGRAADAAAFRDGPR